MNAIGRRMENAVELFEERARTATSYDEVDEFLAFVPGTPRYVAFRCYLLFHAGDLVSVLTRRARHIDGLTVLNPKVGAFGLQREYGEKEVRSVRGVFVILPSSVDGIHRLVSVCRGDFWNIAVQRYVQHTYPRIVPVFFRQPELREALESLERKLGSEYRLMVKEVSMKESRVGLNSNRGPAVYDTDRTWMKTYRPVRDVFDEALERRQWHTSIAFRVQRLVKERDRYATVAFCRLYKYGDVHFDRLYREVTDILLPVLEKAAKERMDLFSNRGIRERRERGFEPAMPLQITYALDVFDQKENLQRFAEVIRKYPHATKAVFHSNPYFHASVADFLDGSSFEVWVLSPRRILVVPQAKASAPALERLISHISIEFREGHVGEYSG